MADPRIQARIDFLKKNRPNDPEIAKLQGRLSTAPGAAAPAPPIDQKANQYASDVAVQGGVNGAFNPTLSDRVGTGDLIADRQRQESDLQGYLGRDLDAQYAKAKQMAEQDLYDRGIPVGSQQYKDAMQMTDDNFSRQRADIRAQALQFGGQEMDRTFNQSEKTRADQLNEQQTAYNTNLTGTQTLSDIDLAYKQLAEQKRQANQTNRINRGQLSLQQQALGRRGGGRSGGSAVAQSPFVDG